MRRFASIGLVLLGASLALVFLTGASSGARKSYDVRAIFDDAGFAVPGEQVRIAGAPVGSIQAVDTCTTHCSAYAPAKKAAVTLAIGTLAFTPFHADATCAIRPQSLIAERYVDCTPGTAAAPSLTKIPSGSGAGSYYLPVARTSSPIDSDIVQGISQQPVRQRFALILNELGTGLAARGADLNTVIHRANPALGYTDQVFQILARENRTLARLASDSDAVLGPLARARNSLSGFVVGANTTAVASATRAADISRSFQLFPSFLRQLQPLMVQLGLLADQGTPLMADLGKSASALGHQFENLIPFANAARPALIALGKSSQQSQPALLASVPLARRLQNLGNQTLPAATSLARLTASLDQTGAIEQLMALLFNGTTAANGFDSFGHYVRSEPLVGQCTAYVKTAIPGCSANFGSGSGTAAAVAPAISRIVQAATLQRAADPVKAGTLKGLLGYLIGSH